MLERLLAERLRAIVADEPPFAVDPGDLVDRMVRTGRRPWWTRRVTRHAGQPRRTGAPGTRLDGANHPANSQM